MSDAKRFPRIEPCEILGDYFPRDEIRANELREKLVAAVHRYRLAVAGSKAEKDKRLVRQLIQIGRHAEALLNLLAEFDSDDRYGFVPDGEAIGRPAIQLIPRLLDPRRILASGAATDSEIPLIRIKLQWLSDRAVSVRRSFDTDWGGKLKARRQRGNQRGEQGQGVELAKECYRSLTAAGIPTLTMRQGKPESSRGYVKIVEWALKEGARRTAKGGNRVGDARRIARLARK